MHDMQKEIEVLKIRFNNVTIEQTLDFIFNNINNDKKGYICTSRK